MRYTRRIPVGRVCLVLFTAAVLLFLYAPIVYTAVNALNRNPALYRWDGVTLRWFRLAFADRAVRDAFFASVQIAIVTSVISVTLALSAGLWLRGRGTRARALLEGATYARLVIPEVVIAVGLFVLFRRFDIQLGSTTVIIGHCVFTSAVAAVVIDSRIGSLDSAIEDAARDLGATPWRVFFRATLPQLWPAILGAALLSFTFSFDNVVTSFFLAGAGVQTLPMFIFGLVRLQITPFANAIGVGVMFVTLLGFALTAIVMRLGTSRPL